MNDTNIYNLSCIVPTHNRKKQLGILLKQLTSEFDYYNIKIDIVVVVDGSTDGTIQMLENTHPYVHLVKGDGSWWYTKSMNEGFQYAKKHLSPDYFLTLNDDVTLASDYFTELAKIIKSTDGKTIIGSIGVSNDKNTQIMTSGNTWKYKFLGVYKNYVPVLKEVDLQNMHGSRPSLTLPGRGMLIPLSVLSAMGGFDERFKQYHSDGDFTLRAISKGYKVLISWDLVIYVKLAQTSSSTSYLNKSFTGLISSFSNPVSRNHLPSKSIFIWRHGNVVSYPIRMIIFLLLCFKNVVKAKLRY